jgi:pimeloyl-ACP methyl ester carboxylesterase
VPVLTLPSGQRLSYAHQGGADPSVLFLPGPTDSWRSYQPVLAELPEELGVIALSLRGHGDSDKPTGGYRVEDFAADVVLLLDALRMQRVVVAGHSGSCLVARRVALDCPERVAGLVLESSPTTLRNDPRLAAFVEDISGLTDPITPDFARSFVADTSSPAIGDELVDLLVSEVLKVPVYVWQATFANLLEYDDTSEVTHIESPTLLVWGDADPLVSRDAQEYLSRAIPDATQLTYHGLGHTPRWEDPKRFSRDVARFARRVAP